MKKTFFVLVITLIAASTIAKAQTLEEVLKSYHEVMGQEVILKSKTSQSTGKMIQMGLEIPFTQYAAHPGKFRVEATFQGMTLIQAFNGEEGWMFNPFVGQTEAQPMSEDEIRSMKLEADYEGYLWNWEDKGHQVTLEENEEIEGTDCFTIKAVTKDGDEITTYLDTESYIPLMARSKTTQQGQEIETETYMSNYNEVDGYVYAGKVETRFEGQVTATIVIDEVALNPELDMKIFESASK